MKFDALHAILTDPEYRALPVDLAQQDTDSKTWWTVMSKLTERATQATIWESAQLIAMLFETYGEHIHSVEMEFDSQSDRGESYMTTHVRINGEHCYDGSMDLEEDVLTATDTIDAQHALKSAVDWLDQQGSSHLLAALPKLQSYMNTIFFSAEQAEKVARDAAPEIEAWARQKRLSQEAGDAPRKRASSKM